MSDFMQAIDAEITRLSDRKVAALDEIRQIEAQVDQLTELRGSYGDPPPAARVSVLVEPAPKPAPAKTPPKKRRSTPVRKAPKRGAASDQILEALRNEGGPLSGNDLVRLTGRGAPTISTALKGLINAKQVESAGMDGRSKLWRLASHHVAGAVKAKPAAPQPIENGRQTPKLEGRIFSMLQHQHLSSAKLAEELGEPVEDVRGVLLKLKREDDVTCTGQLPYDVWRCEP